MRVINDNFAPNGLVASTDIGDCCIRAISYVLNYPYEQICHLFGIKYDSRKKCADINSIKANPISFKKIRSVNLPFVAHNSFLKSGLSLTEFFKKSWTVEKFITIMSKKNPMILSGGLVLYIFPKNKQGKGHAVALVNGAIHDNRPDGSAQQKRELTEYAVLGYSVA